MFISGIQFLKEPEMILCWMRSRVRLTISDFDKCILMNTEMELPLFDNPAVKSSLTYKDRECGAMVGQLATSQPPSNVIERGACIVHAIANDQRPLCFRNRFSDLQLKQICRCLTIIFRDKGIGLRIAKSLDFRIKRSAMYFSSLDFMPTLTWGLIMFAKKSADEPTQKTLAPTEKDRIIYSYP